ncbi:hypothetical protein [Rhodohalobacter sp. 8-1]|uniref:hypothetical protein n=1 Tax=Rhodohalobacter sp. 8-1 TaxID=3131972 RepID=UPI0030EBE5A8
MSDHLYSEEEVARLIRRAVELESERTEQGSTSDKAGLTIQDLEKIAADSGIDPELMRRAAEELKEKNTSPNSQADNIEDNTTISKSEIVAEHWIKATADERMLDNLILELNHRFGTSQEEITWWNELIGDYSGKALVNKTSTSVDWKYTDELELHTLRVLIQQRGEKLRIRVSKRQGWNLSWNSDGLKIFSGVASAILFTTLGIALSYAVMDSPWLGLLGGVALTALFVPLISKLSKNRLRKHRDEVTEIAENLVVQAKQLASESTSFKSANKTVNHDTSEIEIDTVSFSSESENRSSSGRLRNNLRN